jgi:hypothetical protein
VWDDAGMAADLGRRQEVGLLAVELGRVAFLVAAFFLVAFLVVVFLVATLAVFVAFFVAPFPALVPAAFFLPVLPFLVAAIRLRASRSGLSLATGTRCRTLQML